VKAKFGLFYPQVGQSFKAFRDRALLAEQLGYDSIFCVDHMWQRGMPEVDHLEAWTLLSALAASTEKIRFGALVLCNSYRNPALLAKMASSLDHISGGRLVLGIGAGWMDEEYRGYGYGFPSTLERIEQLDEALEVMLKTLGDFIRQGPTDKELDDAKKNITGGFVLRIDSNKKLVEYIAMIGFYELPLDYLDWFPKQVETVSREAVADAFKRRIHPDRFQTVLVGGGAKPAGE